MDIDTILELEKEFTNNNFNGSGEDFKLIMGINNDIIVSAPHSVRHVRNGKVLPTDKFTGTICKLLNKDLNIPVIYKDRNLNDDVNFDVMSNYEIELIKYIKDNKVKCLIDLHKSKSTHDYDILIADNYSENLQSRDYLYPIVKGIVSKYDYKLEHNTAFFAGGNGVLSKEISDHTSIPCIEIEINSKILNLKNIEQFENTYNMIKEIVTALDRILD